MAEVEIEVGSQDQIVGIHHRTADIRQKVESQQQELEIAAVVVVPAG